ncbi:MAG: bifunctional phosphopantothenoylcysteine decarboxylase/phosphopantothenate--cysteine ligase CoaBC [Chloroflexota bacterium]
MTIFSNKNIILGVTGSIAAYKAADLASRLTQAGAHVEILLTSAAEKFVTALTFQSVTGRRAFTDTELWGGEAHVLHVGLGHSADLLVIAPCTANTIAKLASGIADNLLTITALAANCPILIAPAMDAGMFSHPATQANIEILRQREVTVIGPEEGWMASGLVGLGRMTEPADLFGQIRLTLGRGGPLNGKKIVVTASGTQEPIDPVRMITNRSSGKQGYALAQAALDAGGNVVLITAPTCLNPPIGARILEVGTAEQMLAAVLAESADADALLMAAAVADFRPKRVATEKLKKRDGIPRVELEAVPDILAAVAELRSGTKRPRCVVGFAAESRDLLDNASAKLHSKKLDLIVANDISSPDAGFATDTNRVTFIYADSNKEVLPLMSKSEVGERVIERLLGLLEQ